MNKFFYIMPDQRTLEAPGHSIDARDLGYSEDMDSHQRAVFTGRLRGFLSHFEHAKYFYNVIPLLDPVTNQAIKMLIQEENFNLGSIEDGIKGLKQLYLNHDLIRQCPSISQFTAPSKYAHLVLAGPSLEEDIEEIKKSKRLGYTIFACDAVYRRLLKEDIVPDVVVTTERVSGTYNFLKDITLPMKPPILVATKVAFHPTLSLWRGPLAFISSSRPEISYFYGEEDSIRHNPHVAETSLAVIDWLNFDTCLISGLDLVLEGNKSHADLVGMSNKAAQVREVSKEKVYCNDGLSRETTPIYNSFAHQLQSFFKRSRLTCYTRARKARLIEGIYFKEYFPRHKSKAIPFDARPQKVKPKQPILVGPAWSHLFNVIIKAQSIKELWVYRGPLASTIVKPLIRDASMTFRQDALVVTEQTKALDLLKSFARHPHQNLWG